MRATPSPPSPPSSQAIADAALDLIDVNYEVLPHVIDVEEAMRRTRRCCTTTCSPQGVDADADASRPTSPSACISRGDVEAGFATPT